MSSIANILNIKDSSTTYSCYGYTSSDEALSSAVMEPSYLEVKKNGTTYYIGLVKTSDKGATGFDTPLTVTKNGVQYIVQTEVEQTIHATKFEEMGFNKTNEVTFRPWKTYTTGPLYEWK